MAKADLHQLIDSLPDEAVDGAALLLQRVMLGQVVPAQAWVLTAEWQDQLRQSLADLATAQSRRFDSDEEFLASL